VKFTVNLECTPEEGRAFLGLPDVQPMQAAILAQLQERLGASLHALDGETLMKTWLPASLDALARWQELFLAGASGAKPAKK
jgi:hypothetical protein